MQARILQAGAAAVRPGGVLVYSVCTISRAEGETVAQRFLAGHPDFAPDPFESCDPGTSHLQLLPHLDGTDGFFVARFRRR